MVMAVVTVTKVPPSLRGDLTKWMQEIATGVYVGNFSTRVKEQLWERIKKSVGSGQATISYTANNELGYQFETYHTHRQNVSFDGIPLVMISKIGKDSDTAVQKGFSKAATYRQARKYTNNKKDSKSKNPNLSSKHGEKPYVVVDIETDGLNSKENHMIELAAVKVKDKEIETYQSFLQYDFDLPKEISALTGITQKMLVDNGRNVETVLVGFSDFVNDLPIVGYNLQFDIAFINRYFETYDIQKLTNKKYDLLKYIKKENMFLSSYKLADVLPVYEVNVTLNHRALDDAHAIFKLSTKVNAFNKIWD